MPKRRSTDWQRLNEEQRQLVVKAAIATALTAPAMHDRVTPRDVGTMCEFYGAGPHRRNVKLRLYWEVAFDPISDDYTAEDCDARELLYKWVPYVDAAYPPHRYENGLIPISWYVEGDGTFETAPHSYRHSDGDEDFLSFFTWPVTPEGPINFVTLPVVDKLWRKGRCDKGGFIQEATGWKPAAMQPFVFLPSLMWTGSGMGRAWHKYHKYHDEHTAETGLGASA